MHKTNIDVSLESLVARCIYYAEHPFIFGFQQKMPTRYSRLPTFAHFSFKIVELCIYFVPKGGRGALSPIHHQLLRHHKYNLKFYFYLIIIHTHFSQIHIARQMTKQRLNENRLPDPGKRCLSPNHIMKIFYKYFSDTFTK